MKYWEVPNSWLAFPPYTITPILQHSDLVSNQRADQYRHLRYPLGVRT